MDYVFIILLNMTIWYYIGRRLTGIYNLENKINELDEEYRLFVKVHGPPLKK